MSASLIKFMCMSKTYWRILLMLAFFIQCTEVEEGEWSIWILRKQMQSSATEQPLEWLHSMCSLCPLSCSSESESIWSLTAWDNLGGSDMPIHGTSNFPTFKTVATKTGHVVSQSTCSPEFNFSFRARQSSQLAHLLKIAFVTGPFWSIMESIFYG